jgi:hypothetical protein
MQLKFEGQAIIDAAGGVRFAGQYDGDGQTRIVICQVERAALVDRCKLINPTPDEVLAAYRSISSEVNKLASAQFAGGIMKPVITVADLARTAA